MPQNKRAEEYRHLAQECRSVAGTLSTPEARNDMLAMADQWDRLAKIYDYATNLRKPTD
jgi:hypothetical protein